MTFFLRSRWPVLAAAVAIAAVGVGLGNWQMNRRAEKAAELARMDAAPIPLDQALEDPEGGEYRRVVAEGRLLLGETVLLDGRSRGLEAGGRVVTPLALRGGERAVLVDRGFVPKSDFERFLAPAGATESARVAGVLDRLPELPLPEGEAPRRTRWLRLHRAALERQIGVPLEPWLLVKTESAQGELPIAEAPAPTLSPQDHGYYAITWYGTAVTALVVGGAYVIAGGRRPPASREV